MGGHLGHQARIARRRRVVDEIKRSRLGGVCPITLDEPFDPPPRRYAQIYESPNYVNIIYSDDSWRAHPAYPDWKLVTVIDLDTGEPVERPREEADDEKLEAALEGYWTHLLCPSCEAVFYVEDELKGGEAVTCDACGTDSVVAGAGL